MENSKNCIMNLWNYGNVIEFTETEKEIKIDISDFDNKKTDQLLKELNSLNLKKVKELTIKNKLFKLTLN